MRTCTGIRTRMRKPMCMRMRIMHSMRTRTSFAKTLTSPCCGKNSYLRLIKCNHRLMSQ